jgi:FkbM family methyltransferase
MSIVNILARSIVRMYPPLRGKGRITSFARKRISGNAIFLDKFGNRFLLDLDNYVDSMIFLEGQYETENILYLAQWAAKRERCQFLDIGANIGAYTVHLCKHPNIACVHAFEPVPRNHAQLLANLWLNDALHRVTVHQTALSDQDGEAMIHVPPTRRKRNEYQYNTSASSLTRQSAQDEAIQVSLRKVDSVFHARGANVLIKLDVEGHESATLAGMDDCLRFNNCVLLMEIWPENLDRLMKQMEALEYQREGVSLWGDNYVFTRKTPV